MKTKTIVTLALVSVLVLAVLMMISLTTSAMADKMPMEPLGGKLPFSSKASAGNLAEKLTW